MLRGCDGDLILLPRVHCATNSDFSTTLNATPPSAHCIDGRLPSCIFVHLPFADADFLQLHFFWWLRPKRPPAPNATSSKEKSEKLWSEDVLWKVNLIYLIWSHLTYKQSGSRILTGCVNIMLQYFYILKQKALSCIVIVLHTIKSCILYI